jgi:hypothetical protein
MHKAEISWKREDADGNKLSVYAHCFGGQWFFFSRHRRYDEWAAMKDPPLEDWLELLDGVIRRIQRRQRRPEEEVKIRAEIHRRYPDAALPT